MLWVTIRTIAPVFFLIGLGVVLRLKNQLPETVNAALSRLVYRVGLPALIFSKIASAPLRTLWDARESGFILISTTILFFILWIASRPFFKDPRDWSAFVQAAYRGNTAIVGFAVVQSAYGDAGLAHAVVHLAFIIPIYNTLAVMILSYANPALNVSAKGIPLSIIKNPLIISLLLALPFGFFQWEVPSVFMVTLQKLSNMVLPLALIAIGADLRMHLSRQYTVPIASASALRLVVLPVIQMIAAWLLGIRGQALGIIVLLLASPTAVSSYVMAKALGSNEKLTAQIIVSSTALSIATMALFVLWGQISHWY